MKAVILAAGQGKRLGNYTMGKPKCLLPLGEETILSREMRMLQKAGIPHDRIYVLAGYRSDLLQNMDAHVIVNSRYDQMENSYSLGIALQVVDDDDVLILDADLCFAYDLLAELLQAPYPNVLLSRKAKDSDESTGIVVDGQGRVKAIGKSYTGTGYVYLSIFKVAKRTIPDFRSALLDDKNVHTWYTAAITDICSQYPWRNLVTNQPWHEIDTIEDYHETLAMFGLG